MSEKKAPGKLAHAKGTQKSAKSATKQAAKKADGESAVFAKIAALPEPYRALGERLHARNKRRTSLCLKSASAT